MIYHLCEASFQVDYRDGNHRMDKPKSLHLPDSIEIASLKGLEALVPRN